MEIDWVICVDIIGVQQKLPEYATMFFKVFHMEGPWEPWHDRNSVQWIKSILDSYLVIEVLLLCTIKIDDFWVIAVTVC